MAKPLSKPLEDSTSSLNSTDRLKWPTSEKEMSKTPRVYRIHRMNSFEWQAFVTDQDIEYPIGKPDTYELVLRKVSLCMRYEGQAEFLAFRSKTKGETPHAH